MNIFKLLKCILQASFNMFYVINCEKKCNRFASGSCKNSVSTEKVRLNINSWGEENPKQNREENNDN